MTTPEYQATLARIRESVTELDRSVRAGAIEVVTARVVALTDGQAVDDGTLVLALVRVTHLGLVTRRGASLEAPPAQSTQAAPDPHALERAQRQRADTVDLGLIALTAAAAIVNEPRGGGAGLILDRDTLVELALEIAAPEQHRLLRERALLLIAATLEPLSRGERALLVGVEALRILRRYASGKGASRFVQRAALTLVVQIEGAEVEERLRDILSTSMGPDGMIVRYHAISLVPRSALARGPRLRLVWSARKDPSEHVRQGVVRALAVLAATDPRALVCLARLSLADDCPRVGGLGILELAQAAAHPERGSRAARHFARVLVAACRGKQPVLQRAALAGMRRVVQSPQAPLLMRDMGRAIEALIQGASLDMAEMAATLARELDLENTPAAAALCAELRVATRNHREGRPFRLELPAGVDERKLEQAAYVVACLDLCLEIRHRRARIYELRRGEHRSFRVWRLIHELRHRDPAKRQSYLHSHARSARPFTSTVPLRQAEVTPTSVPGERRALIGHSWGTFLPRIDDVFSACHARDGKRLICAFGTLTVRAPPGFWQRLKLQARLTRRYAELSELRDQSLIDATRDGKRRFALELRRLGVEIELTDSEVVVGGQKLCLVPAFIQQYFCSMLPLPLVLWLEDALQYLVSPSGNTAWHLSLVVWGLLALMVMRASGVQRRFAKAKRQIPLSIGGWGSRGKSGTERLKSALFHSLHTDVVSKTTGCEAMLILARRDQTAHEIFLYRPYDKATIWEQEKVVEYAQSLGAQVFLWECMALQPEFVDILNREWMKDTITTLTNAYPDHEDIMGPSGEDVARVIGRFIPRGGTVLSSEEQMEAIIRESAVVAGSQIIEVDELAADLIPRDLLARFPYQEHPRNVALALRMAEHLGFDRERSLIDMADHVVPDLGVLNTFPKIEYKGRSLVFSNGMSANERAGFMSNWNRLYFVTHDPDKHPETCLVAVINNRADRVPRSRVFAEVFARDVAVDRMVVIGTNQNGIKQFMHEAIAIEAAKLSPPQSSSDAPAWLSTTFDKLGIPKTLEAVERRLRLMSASLLGRSPSDEARAEIDRCISELVAKLADDAAPEFADLAQLETRVTALVSPLSDALGRHAATEMGWAQTPEDKQREHHGPACYLVYPWTVRRYFTRRLAEIIDPASSSTHLEQLRAFYCRNFHGRIIILEDSDSTGDQVVDFIFQHIPPGLHAETMGCQNIKGTGLDFVYRFVELQRVHDWLVKMDLEPSERTAIIGQMKGHVDYGLFGCQYAMKRIRKLLEEKPAEWAEHLGMLPELMTYLEQREQFFIGKMARNKVAKSRWHILLGKIEPWVDNLDGIRRRKRAEHIMHALIEGGMDTASAAEQLRNVVGRQKGGWLAKDFQRFWERVLPSKTGT